ADDAAVAVGRRRLRPVHLVRDSEPATEIDAADVVARRPEIPDETRNPAEGKAERLEIRELRADMDIDADDFNAGKPARALIKRERPRPRYAELVFGLTGRDLFVGPGVHIGIDAEGDGGAPAHGPGDFAQRLELGLGFHVELVNSGLQRLAHLVP